MSTPAPHQPSDGVHLRVVSAEEWKRTRLVLLAQEKEATRARDALAAERRRQPAMHVDASYAFTGPDGTLSLSDLFAGRRQLIVYHFMLATASAKPCVGCSMVADNIGHLAHLHARDTTLVMASLAPYDHIAGVKARMGWTHPWVSTSAAFNNACDVPHGGFALNVFIKDGSSILRTYFTTGRGIESLGSIWSLLDITPLGRQEEWEDSPAGWPQSPPFQWWRHHDQYGV
jgi:predicted dithiol-disulfide oxidoreductase (DUF899 family)